MKGTGIIYVFNFLGDFIEEDTIAAITDKYFSGRRSILNRCLLKNSIHKKYYYFLKTKEFVLKYKKAEHNILFSKKDPYDKKEETKKVYSPEDKWRIVNRRKTDSEFAKEFNTTIVSIRSSRSKWKMSFNNF